MEDKFKPNRKTNEKGLKEMTKFKVRCTKTRDGRYIEGKIYEVDELGRMVDEQGYEGYECDTGSFEAWYKECRWSKYAFELVKPVKQSIHIYNDGKVTTAKLCEDRKTVKTATATCHPDDEFDFEIGAEIAFGRLFGREPEQPSKPELPKVREVKRPAKVGEWIKIVDLKPPHTGYNLGDIIKVEGTSMVVDDVVKKPYWVTSDEYVVLEGYEPPKPSIDWDAFKQGEFAVHCDTEEKATAFLKECEDRGLKWASGQKATAYSFWRGYKGNTCYQHSWANGGMQFCSKVFYAAEGTEVIPYR